MAFASFSDRLYVKVLETSELAPAGGFRLQNDQEISHIILTMYMRGVATTQQLRIKIFADAQLTKPVATGEWLTVRQATSGDASWLGLIRFDMTPSVNVDASAVAERYVGVESQNYARTGDTFYVGFALDWPLAINAREAGSGLAFSMALYGRRGVRYL